MTISIKFNLQRSSTVEQTKKKEFRSCRSSGVAEWGFASSTPVAPELLNS
jgi:hypothetical protein